MKVAGGELRKESNFFLIRAPDNLLAETKNSVLLLKKNPAGFQPKPPPNEKMFVIEEVPAIFEEEQLGWLARVRSRLRIGAGSRFLSSVGCTILAIGVGIALDELVEWSLKSSYVR